MTKRLSIFILCLCAAITAVQAQILNNRIAVANSRASGPAQQAVLANHGSSTELIMNADFSATPSTDRASWDFAFRTSLVHCAGVRLRILVQNPQLAAPFDIYLKFASTWYAAHFTPTRNNAWETIFIPKTKFKPEGNPESWSQCSLLRIAAYKKGAGHLSIHLAELECVRPNASFAILRSGTTAAGIKESYRFAETLGDALTSYGLRPAVIEDADCQTIHLKPYAFAFVPLVSASSPSQQTAIANLIKRGSKVGVFHSLPPIIAAHMKVPNSTYIQAKDLPAALAGVVPYADKLPDTNAFRQPSTSFIGVTTGLQQLNVTALWYDTNNKATTWPAIIQTDNGFWMTHVFLNVDPQNAVPLLVEQTSKFLPNIKQIAATTCLEEASVAYQDAPRHVQPQIAASLEAAHRLLQSGQFKTSIQFSNRCKQLAAAPPIQQVAAPANEFRAVWCRSLSGLPGQSWNNVIPLLKQNHITAVFPFTASPYAANFSTSLLPRQPFQPAFEECIAAARKHGVQVHAWINCLHAVEAPDNFKQAMKKANRLQIDAAGKPIDWLCPSNPQNRSQVVNIARTIAQSFPVDGIHLDLIRFCSSQTCYCSTCKGYFENHIQHKIAHWPADVLAAGPLRNEWLAFRQMVISSLVAECAQAAKAARPSVKVSAAVFPDLELARKTVAQNWPEWFRPNGIDFICPMNYKSTTMLFEADIQRQAQQLGTPKRILPGIGVSSERLPLDEVRRQINATRANGMPGFILFQLGPREATDILPAIK